MANKTKSRLRVAVEAIAQFVVAGVVILAVQHFFK